MDLTTSLIEVPAELSDVDKLIYLVRLSDKADSLTREGLYKVFEEKSWESKFSSWGEFVSSPDGLNKSESWASKRLGVHEHYTIEGGVSQDKLIGIPNESLYLAKFVKGTVEEQLAIANTLNRAEIKEARIDGGHIHGEETVEIYKCCGMRKETT